MKSASTPKSASKPNMNAIADEANKILRLLDAVCILIAPMVAVVVGVTLLKHSWDDGAITAAFARTYADTGRIALTPISVQVEGFSTLLWMYLLALVHLISPGTSFLIAWMKILSGISFALSLFVFREIGKRVFHCEWLVTLSIFLLAFAIAPYREVLNGMEMNFYMLLTLCLFLVLLLAPAQPRLNLLIPLIVAMIILIRFESPFLLFVAACAALLQGGNRKVSAAILAASTLACFVLTEVWRFHTFRVLMPNTVYAKMWPPYSTIYTIRGIASSRYHAILEIGQVLFAPIVAVCIVLVWSVVRCKTDIFAGLWRQNRLILMMAAGGVAFEMLLGQNVGYAGRMIIPFVPFMILSLLLLMERISSSAGSFRIVISAMVVGHFTGWVVYGLLSPQSSVPGPPTVTRIEKIGIAVDEVRQSIGHSNMKVMLPDVGASALCCEALNILDSGLLANPYLASRGYGAFREYFESQNPEIVETHDTWSEHSGIYSNRLLANYQLANIHHVRLLLRRDIYRELQGKLGRVVPIASSSECQGSSSEDRAFAVGEGTCLIVE